MIYVPAETFKADKDEFSISLHVDSLAVEGLEDGIWLSAERLLFPVAQKQLKGKDTVVSLNHVVQFNSSGKSQSTT